MQQNSLHVANYSFFSMAIPYIVCTEIKTDKESYLNVNQACPPDEMRGNICQ